jgi:hypothetical protein
MVKGEEVMAVAIKPLRHRRRTAQRGKSMSQSQRWGKVVTIMPVPQGDITTSDILAPEVEEVVEEVEEEVIPFERIDTDEDWEQA